MPAPSDRKEDRSKKAAPPKEPKSQAWGGTWPPKTEDTLGGMGAQFETQRKKAATSRQETHDCRTRA
ncbi:hypothetical protein AC578_9599 [Pseudocercospora eumusae]|uniref:Uncharacterized protein n=1 Tax=Pseudocercospora eumusae TaxID=321146 RepID=A0A139GY00_9PEZI|nr:hypothetical protein AC578_9599 [Pseudocercospora eumusae]